MKKVVPISAVAAALTVSAISVTPSYAAPFQNCSEARAVGVVNIPSTSPNYSPDLDGNGDGWACEEPGFTPGAPTGNVPAPDPVAPSVPQPAVPVSEEPWAWDNCSEAFANGVSNIPAGTPGYGTHLDSDFDGIGCELNGDDTAGVVPATLTEAAGATDQTGVVPGSQVEQIPVGGADTGVAVKQGSAVPGEAIVVGAAALGVAALGGLALRRSRAL